MRFDLTGFLPENLVSMEQMAVAGNNSDGHIAFPQHLFYEHDFQLFEVTQSSGTVQLTRDVDYRFVFVIPGFRNRDSRYAVYAAVDLLDKKQNAVYRASYRALGADVNTDIVETRRFFLDNDESSTDFFAMLIDYAHVPDSERLADATLTLSGTLVSYKSVIGAMEVSARKTSTDSQTGTSSGGDVADATATTKGVMQLAGDLTGSADRPRVVGLSDKLSAADAEAIYVKKTEMAISINGQTSDTFTLSAADVQAYTTDQVDQLLDTIRTSLTTLQNTVVLSVNDQTPDEQGNVVVQGGDGSPTDGGNF